MFVVLKEFSNSKKTEFQILNSYFTLFPTLIAVNNAKTILITLTMNADLALIRYSLRCGSFDAAFDAATKTLKKSRNRGVLLFWKACSRGLCGEHQDCIRELEAMRKQHRFLDYAIISALIWFHEEAGVYDIGELTKLEIASKAALDCIHIDGALLAADFHLHIGKNFQEVQRCIRMSSSDVRSRSPGQLKVVRQQLNRLELWLCVFSGEAFRRGDDNAVDLDSSEGDIDSLMAKAKYYELVGNVNGATEALSTIIADDETFFPALIERAKMYLIQMKYALAKDSAQQSFVIGRGHIEALRVLTLILFLTNDNGAQRLEHLEQLSSKLNGEALPKIERKLEVTKLFSRLCGNDKAVLEITTQLVSEACDIELDNWESRMEFARQLRRLGRYDEALCQYQFASNLDQGNTDTLEGMILCQVLSGALEEAKQQIEFLELVQDEESVNEEMLFVQLLINDGAKTTDVVRLTRNLVLHFSGIIQNTSFEYSSFDLGMVFDVAMHFISTYQFCKESLMDDAEDAHVELSNEVCDLLHHVTKRYPSDGTALALVAKVKYEMKDFSAAETMFQPNVNTCAPNALLTVIEAQIKLSKNNISASRQSLEQALSQEFAIQRDPLYRLVKGSLHANEGAYEAAKEYLSSLLAHVTKTSNIPRLGMISPQDKFQCFVKLAEALRGLHVEKELEDLLYLADETFSNEEAFHFLRFKSDLYLDSGNVHKALELYDSISTESMQYDAAQAAKADIYLNHLHNQKGYIKCHLNLLRTNKTPSAYLRLGDAYMKINSPVDAIESFSHALKLEPQNETLAIRIGDTLICSHEYKQAVSHYQEFLQTSPDSCRVQQNLTSLKQSLSGNQSLSMQIDKADEQIDLLVLCDVYLQQSKVDEALTLCIEFIETNSDHYKVTYKYVSLLSRLGKRDELNKISLQLDGTDETMSITGGHYLCQGLCQRMLGDPIAALKYFDLARNSKEWSQIASINMIQIYLRIDDFAFWCSSRSALALDEGSLKSASILINQQIDSDSNEAMILRGYWEVIKAFDNGNFDAPTKHFNGILKGDKDNIAALLGLAQVYTFSSTATKVRNTLKRIAKTPHDFEFMAEYERSYLMLAVDYIERDKVDLAHDLCKRCLFYNRFCAKAWELLGQTFELKNGCHTSDTIECYEKCWSIGNYRSCPVGYRLAALYLKTNRPVDGLKVALNCQNLAPDHVNIKSLISNCITSLKQ